MLIIDVYNMLMRAIVAYPQLNSNGEPAGGYVGFLKMMRRIVNETAPKAVYCAWEGGGSSKRRSLFAEYKLGSRPEKMNRFYEDDIPTTEENRKHQTLVLLRSLKFLPVCQLYVSDAEGDDLIAYLCEGPLRDERRIIASSDRDFYQLMNDKTTIYNLHKKKVITAGDVKEEFRISANNFAIAKCIAGDKSDNIPGVRGMGFKTLAKLFPMLGLEDDVLLDDVMNYCRSHSEKAAYKRILDAESDIRRNWKLIHLNGNMIPYEQTVKIDKAVKTFEPSVNTMGLVKLLIKEGINDFNVQEYVMSLHGIEGIRYGSK